MGLAQQLMGGVVYVDSAPLIYFFEKKEGFFQQLNEFFKVCEKGEITLITSALTVSEVLTYPILIKKTKLIKEYENFFETSNSIRVFDIGIPEAKLSAELRALHNLKTPDALHVATAMECSATHFLTNDFKLKKIPSIEIVTLK
jgi:predicted nucleic acid-binding protein